MEGDGGAIKGEQSGDQEKLNGDSPLCAETGNSCRVGPGLQPEKGQVVCWVQRLR